MIHTRLRLAFLALSLPFLCQAYIYDNRYLPMYGTPQPRTCAERSYTEARLFLIAANEAHSDDLSRKLGLFEVSGRYRQEYLGGALALIGKVDPIIEFRPEWGRREIPWDVNGDISSQGAMVSFEVPLSNSWSFGASLPFMRVVSRQTFALSHDPVNNAYVNLMLEGSDENELDDLRREAHTRLGLTGAVWQATGLDDTDIYLRYGIIKNYVSKFRKLDMSALIGALLPSGVKRDINNPASIPFGGNGHYGIYLGGIVEAELKEDWSAGFETQLIRRFSRTSVQRMSINGEPYIFGGLVGEARVEPGLTFMIAPYVRLENLRKSFGVTAKYTAVVHGEDYWIDARCADDINALIFHGDPVRPQFGATNDLSSWHADYVTVSAFYDFKRMGLSDRCLMPRLFFEWDIPAGILINHRSAKAQRVSLGLDIIF